MPVNILGIESSCDDTAAAVVGDGVLLSNIIASQDVHRKFGGVVPELASREHLRNIGYVVRQAFCDAAIQRVLPRIHRFQVPGLRLQHDVRDSR